MASPHIAGIGALMKALHPTWLPSEIKSALMTSTMDTVSSAGDPFAQGSGFVQPNAAADPGLVYPTTPNEYRSFMVSLGVQFAPPFNTLPPITASNLNQASISVGKMAGTETVTRHVKNVSGATTTFTASINVPGIDAVVTPSRPETDISSGARLPSVMSKSVEPAAVTPSTWTSPGALTTTG